MNAVRTLRRPSPHRERGLATLFATVVLLIASTLLVLYIARPVVGDLRIVGNELRSRQAFDAAQATIDLLIRQHNELRTFAGQTWSAPAGADTDVPTGTAVFCRRDVVPTSVTCPATPGPPVCAAPNSRDLSAWIVACGWSDDRSGRRRIITLASKGNPLPGNLNNPITAGAAVDFTTGNATVVNYFGNLTVWSGGSFTTGSGGTVGVMVRNPAHPTPYSTEQEVADGVGSGNQCSDHFLCISGTGTGVPISVIDQDLSLARLAANPDLFFMNFAGMPPAEYRAAMADAVVAGADIDNAFTSANQGGDKVYWIDGDATLSGDVGTPEHPVVLVIDGNLTMPGNTTVHGVLIVRGALTARGSPRVRGALVAGNLKADANGAVTVIFEPGTTERVRQQTGRFVSAPGAWRDF